MKSASIKQKPKDFLVLIVFLQFIVYATVFFNIPVARQVILFLYLTFVPGFVVVKMLRIGALDRLETVLFSVGISVASLMLVGMILNTFYPMLGISQPLSPIPLLVVLNSIVLLGAIFVYLRGNFELLSPGQFKISPFALLFTTLPILSIIGAVYVTVYDNNLIFLFMLVVIPLLFSIGVLSKKLLPSKLYPVAILMISIALLFHYSLISNYIVAFGSDVTGEYLVFKATEKNLYWNSTSPNIAGGIASFGSVKLGAMLSITILPTIYSGLLNIDTQLVFKILFPLIFSFVPLVMFAVWRAQFGKKIAFISAFLFMSQATFFAEMLGLQRQMIAELFFVSLLLVLFNNRIKPANKILLFLIFSFALITSHYALAAIFLFFIFFVLISLVLLRRPNKNITLSMVVLFSVLMFFWYIFTSNSGTFDTFLWFGDSIYRQLGDFFNPASRGEMVLRGLGVEASPSVWNTLSRIFAYITQALIVIGFIGLIIKRKKIFVQREYFSFSSATVALLVALIIVPGLANTLNMTRFYHILLIFLAPLCILGATFVANFVHRKRMEVMASIVVLLVLVPYFLFQSGFVYEVTKSDSWSIPLSNYRMDTLRLYGSLGYLDAYNVFGAQWLSGNVIVEKTKIYSDYFARGELRGYGLVDVNYVEILSNTTTVDSNGVVYLSPLNVIEKKVTSESLSWNTSELQFLIDLNSVYSNGKVYICKNFQ